MGEWFAQVGYEGQLATWIVASFILYLLVTQIVWQSRWLFSTMYLPTLTSSDRYNPDPDGGSARRIGQLSSDLMPWVGEAIRFFYYLGIPFLAILNGLLGVDLLGISGTNWIAGKNEQGFLWEDWARGTGLALTVFLAVALVWTIGRLVSRRAGLAPVARSVPEPLWQRLLHALYDQVHWAFYRSGPILWLNDLYWGTLVGLSLVLLQYASNPAYRWSLKSPETASVPLIRLGMACASALLFLATQNLWLTTAVHFAITALLLTHSIPGVTRAIE